MDEYNVNELEKVDGAADKTIDAPVDEAAEVADESIAAADGTTNEDTANDVNLTTLAVQGDGNGQAINVKKSPLFDNLTLFLIMMVIGFVASIVVCQLFGNWYLGFILGGYLGTALGLVSLFVRKFGSKK